MLPKYEGRVRELGAMSQQLSRNSKNKTESEKYIQEYQELQKDFNEIKMSTESSKSKYVTRFLFLQSVLGYSICISA